MTRTNAAGVPVLTYLDGGTRDGRPWADLVKVVGPDPVPLILDQLAGWAVSAPVELGRELLTLGAAEPGDDAKALTDWSGPRPLAAPTPPVWATFSVL